MGGMAVHTYTLYIWALMEVCCRLHGRPLYSREESPVLIGRTAVCLNEVAVQTETRRRCRQLIAPVSRPYVLPPLPVA